MVSTTIMLRRHPRKPPFKEVFGHYRDGYGSVCASSDEGVIYDNE